MEESRVVRTIEELSLNAWPAVQTLLVGGWVVRFAGGYTRRANSVIPLYPVYGDPEAQIAACEHFYQAQGLPVIFKMTSACTPSDLDERLAARGYVFEAHTSVQVLSLEAEERMIPAGLAFAPQPDEAWQAAFARMHHLKGAAVTKHRRILKQILPDTCYAALSVAGQIAACGLAVLQDGYLGIFDIITDEGQRRKGYAGQLMQGLLAWGRQHGAHSAYLQVMLNNPPALALYDGLGFREAYHYWYRVKV